ncbi:MAG: polymerase [Sphingobacteriaceae bacterium]|nr:MAG: polymerase [Sphingobacteriaceae bacterium]
MKKLFILLLITAICHTIQAQSILPKFIRKMYFDKDTGKRSSFVVLPALTSAPETGIEAGGAALYSFYTDTVHRETRVSNIYAYATITAKGQNRLNLSTNRWTSQNKYHYTAAINYINFPADFYGIGNNTRKADAELLGEKRYRLNLAAEKLVAKSLYVGFVAGAVSYGYKVNKPNGIFTTSNLVEDREGGSFVYVGPSLIYDNRNNNTYTTKGMIVNAYFNAMQGIFGNNSYQGGFFNIEYAQFFSLSRSLVLGFNIQEQSLVGGRSPFYLLPMMGNDEMMRGYYGGRYRDRNFIAGQTELRYRINERFGLAGFVGTGQVFNSTFKFNALKPNYGGGVRYFFDIEKGLSARLDYGFGQQVSGEKRQGGFYIGLGQAF